MRGNRTRLEAELRTECDKRGWKVRRWHPGEALRKARSSECVVAQVSKELFVLVDLQTVLRAPDPVAFFRAEIDKAMAAELVA